MERFPDWEQRLNDYIAGIRFAEHEWGEHDCAAAWAGAIKAMTGVDLMEAYRGRYSTEKGAMALIRGSGYPDLAHLLDDQLPRVARPMAQRGDLLMVKGGHLAIVWDMDALAVGENALTKQTGIIRVPRDQWRKAWKIG